MKQFQIRLNNVAISINDLDKIAAEVFNVPFSEHEYAKPVGGLDWYNVIGWQIASKPVTTWEEVSLALNDYLSDCVDDKVRVVFAPYFSLIDKFEELGYVPVTL